MLIYVAILAFLILGESLTGQQVLGLVLTAVGAVMVQIKGRTPALAGDTV
jgi:uncharacterized membrane protein